LNEHYPLAPFRVRNQDTLCAIMRAYPLATVITGTAGEARMTLLPLLVRESGDGEIRLLGHLDGNNEQAADLVPGAPLSFQSIGPDSYASPDLYPDAQLPGWLYVSVQGHGVVDALLDKRELRELLVSSSSEFGGTDQQFTLASDDQRIDLYIDQIRGFRIRVDKMSGIAKLAQDKGKRDAEIAKNFLATQDNSSSMSLFDRLLDESV
jgi:transcriptional regulator